MSKYKVGDILYFGSPSENEQSHVLLLLADVETGDWMYSGLYLSGDAGEPYGREMIIAQEVGLTYGYIDLFEKLIKEKPAFKPKCICPLYELVNLGCKCGGL